MIWRSCPRYCGELHQQRELTQIMNPVGDRVTRYVPPGQWACQVRVRGVSGTVLMVVA
jgi:hypothetical protein